MNSFVLQFGIHGVCYILQHGIHGFCYILQHGIHGFCYFAPLEMIATQEYVLALQHSPSFHRACLVETKFSKFLIFTIKLYIDLTICRAEVLVPSLDCYKKQISWKYRECTR